MGGWQRQCLFVILLSSFLVLAVNGVPNNTPGNGAHYSFALCALCNNLLHCSLDISQAVVKADNEDKQDATMLADAEDQEDPDDEQLDMQQDDDEPDDSDVEELDYDATDGNDGENNAVQQQGNDHDEDALSKTLQHELIITCALQLFNFLNHFSIWEKV